MSGGYHKKAFFDLIMYYNTLVNCTCILSGFRTLSLFARSADLCLRHSSTVECEKLVPQIDSNVVIFNVRGARFPCNYLQRRIELANNHAKEQSVI